MRYSIRSIFVGYNRIHKLEAINKHPSVPLDFSVFYIDSKENEDTVDFEAHLQSNITDSKGKTVFEFEIIAFCSANKSVERTEQNDLEFKARFIKMANETFKDHFAKHRHLMEYVISTDLNFTPPNY